MGTIARKKKWCKAGHEAYLFGGGYCQQHQHLRKKTTKPERSLTDFYESIWATRKLICEESGRRLFGFSRNYFHHVLPKRHFPEFIFEESNIILLSWIAHDNWEIRGWSDRMHMHIWEKSRAIAKNLLSLLPDSHRWKHKYAEHFGITFDEAKQN